MPRLFEFNNSTECLAQASVLNPPTIYSQDHYVFLWVIFVMSYVHMIVALTIFVVFKRKFDRTRLRPLSLVVVTCVAAASQLNVGVLGPLMEPGYPCVFGLLDQIFIVPLATAPAIARLLVFIFLSRYSRLATYQEGDVSVPVTSDSVSSSAAQVAPSTPGRSATSRLNLQSFFAILFRQLRRQDRGATPTETERRKLLWVLKFMVGYNGLPALTFFLVVPYIVIFFAYIAIFPEFTLGCTNCEGSGVISLSIVILCIAFVSIVITFYLIYIGSEYKDPWGLRAESKWTMMWYLVASASFIAYIEDNPPLRTWNWQFFFSLSFQAAVAVSTYVQVILAHRAWRLAGKPQSLRAGYSASGVHSHAQSEATPHTGGPFTLDQILANPALCNALEAHLRSEYGVESLYFLKDVLAWRAAYFSVAPTARSARARKLVATYIETNGLYSVNIDSKLQQAVLARAGKGSKDATIALELFDDAVHEIRSLLARGSLQRFFLSEAFKTSGVAVESRAKSKKSVNVEDLALVVAPPDA